MHRNKFNAHDYNTQDVRRLYLVFTAFDYILLQTPLFAIQKQTRYMVLFCAALQRCGIVGNTYVLCTVYLSFDIVPSTRHRESVLHIE